MHDRRVDGRTLTFGNQGALFMNAMTWWDWETFSVWSQPWGTAIAGQLKDTALTLIPVSVVPYGTWLEDHPDSTIVKNDLDRPFFQNRGAKATNDFVIGVALQEHATAYYFDRAAEKRVINDSIGDNPIAVFVDGETRDIKVYLRKVEDSELVFDVDDEGRVVDVATGTIWQTDNGVAIDGELRGKVLQQIPWVSSFDWAWLRFFPHTAFWEDDKG